jgi:hypothetical protein
MTSRREFLQIGMVAVTLPLTAAAMGATPIRRGYERVDAVPLYKVLYDTRFPASLAFARRAAERGAVTQAMAGDMTRFWYDDLYHRWAQGPAAIAGLTAHGALFCLERLAWEQRMRVVFRAEHKVATAGPVLHDFAGPAVLLPAACRAVGEPDWATAMADVVTQCPRGLPAAASRQAIGADRGLRTPDSESLFSWVIAPL